MSEIRNTLTESNDIANLLSLALENLDYGNERIIRYSFLIEEALLKWKNHGISESQLCFARFERKNVLQLILAIAGIARIDGIHISLHRSAGVSKDFMKRFIPMCAQFMIWCVATNIISAAFGKRLRVDVAVA